MNQKQKPDHLVKGTAVSGRIRLITAYVFLLSAVYAVSTTMMGPLMPRIIEEYQISLAHGGLFVSAKSVGGILAIVLSMLIADRLSKSTMLSLGFLMFGLGLFLIGMVSLYTVLLAVFFFLGAGSKLADTLFSAYISDLRPERRGYYLNLLHTFFGVGAILSPLYVQVLMARAFTWHQVFSILGLISIALSFLLPLLAKKDQLPEKDKPKPEKTSIGQTLAFMKQQPYMWLICLIMFLYIGHHVVLSVWIPLYMENHLHMTPAVAGLGITSLWLGMTAGRFLVACVVDRFQPSRILALGCLLGALFMAVGLWSDNGNILLVALFLNGLVSGSVLPLLVTIACNRYPEHSGTVSAMIFMTGSLSSIFFPWFSGRLAETVGFFQAMSISWITLLAIVAVAWLLRREKPHPQSPVTP